MVRRTETGYSNSQSLMLVEEELDMLGYQLASLPCDEPVGSRFGANRATPMAIRLLATTFLIAGLCWRSDLAAAQSENTPSEPQQTIEDELASVRTDLVKAFNERDLDLLLSHCLPDVIAIWPNGQVAVGHGGVRKVIDQLLGEDQPLIESYATDPRVEARVVLNDGQTVVSCGEFNDEYTLNRPKGRSVRLDSVWTATLVKDENRWMIASFHLSANAFDNEVITLFTTMLRYWWCGVGLVAGLIAGSIFGFVIGRRRVRKQLGE